MTSETASVAPAKDPGLVERQTVSLFDESRPLTLASGRTIGPINVAFQTYGELSPRRDNAIFICHALTGDAHVAGRHQHDDRKSGWWDGFVGPGKALDTDRYFLLANTAGCYTADEAIRYARLAREAGFNEFIKLEVIGDQETLLPDVAGLIEAATVLAREGFRVMAYTNEDLITALRLEDAGCAAIMPLASPIGSGLGLINPYSIRTIKRRLQTPVIVDAGVGTASDACVTMEQGVDGILMNTALAAASDPVAMATAMRYAVDAGRLAYLAGRMPTREIAVPSSPTSGMLE